MQLGDGLDAAWRRTRCSLETDWMQLRDGLDALDGDCCRQYVGNGLEVLRKTEPGNIILGAHGDLCSKNPSMQKLL